MRRRALGAWLLVPIACGALEARSRLEPPPLEAYVRWGPLRARPLFEVTDLGYDDNILASDDDPQSDYTLTVAPALDGLVLFGSRAFLEFRERLELTGYAEATDLSYANQLGTARLTVPFGRLGVFADFQLDRVHEAPADLDGLRPARAESGLGVGVIVQPSSRTELELRAADTRLRYSDPDFEALGQSIDERLDRDETDLAAEAEWQFVGRTRLTLRGGTRRIDFTDLDPFGREKDSAAWSVEPGIDFGERGALSGAARVGWTSVGASDPGLADYAGITGDAEIAWRPVSRGTATLGWHREPALATYEDAVYLLDEGLALGGRYYLVRLVGIEGEVSRGRISFPGGGSARVDRLAGYELGARLRLSAPGTDRRVEYRVALRREEADSNVEGLDRSRTTVGFDAVLGY